VPGVQAAIVGTGKLSRCQSNATLAAKGPLPPTVYQYVRERWRAVAQPDWTGCN